MRSSQFATLLLWAGSVSAAPLTPALSGPEQHSKTVHTRDLNAASIVAQIAPGSASCADATECRTAAQAAPYLISAMAEYGIYTVGEMAGILALIAFESDDFKYKHNISPGRPGQGTSNMQTYAYNAAYASSIPALQGALQSLGVTTAATAAASDAQANQVLALVTDDQYNFGSGPWYYKTYCSAAQKTQLQAGTDAGFAAYMACVGAAVDSDRTAYWTRAKQAFGLA